MGPLHLMTRNQRYRLWAVLGIFISISLCIFFVLKALDTNIHLYLTPKELIHQKPGQTLRLGGFVIPGSVHYDKTQSGCVAFQVRDEQNTVTIRYTGVLPDLFREGQGIIALGQWTGTQFEATQVLAKHDEGYRPRQEMAYAR